MIDVILYKPSPYGLVFIHDKSLGFIIYNIKHERAYVSYINLWKYHIIFSFYPKFKFNSLALTHTNILASYYSGHLIAF